MPSFSAGPGPMEALLVLGQWALERGHGGRRVPTKDKGPSVGSGLWVLASCSCLLGRGWEWGWSVRVMFPQPESRTLPDQLLVSWKTAGFQCSFLTCKATSKKVSSAS
jgi:hypothetical protein